MGSEGKEEAHKGKLAWVSTEDYCLAYNPAPDKKMFIKAWQVRTGHPRQSDYKTLLTSSQFIPPRLQASGANGYTASPLDRLDTGSRVSLSPTKSSMGSSQTLLISIQSLHSVGPLSLSVPCRALAALRANFVALFLLYTMPQVSWVLALLMFLPPDTPFL